MFRYIIVIAFAAATACGPKAPPPVSGADLVANAVAAHYDVRVDRVDRQNQDFLWTITATNRSGYAWRGTLIIKLVDAANNVVGTHEFPINEMTPAGGVTPGLTFVSPDAPVERGGRVARLKVEVSVAAYEEPAGKK